MSSTMSNSKSFLSAFSLYIQPRMLVIGLLGFSSGLPLLLTLSTLSMWLQSFGLSKSTIGLFTLVSSAYMWKFTWSPLIDKLKVPMLYGLLGRRRSWLLVTQLALVGAILGLGFSDPLHNLHQTAIWAVLVAFASASQDIVIDAYRIETVSRDELAAAGAMEVNGYRLGMVVAGGGALILADTWGWQFMYVIMAACVGVGILTTLFCREPAITRQTERSYPTLMSWIKDAVFNPFLDFVKKPGWPLILLFILLYKFGDNIIGSMGSIFYKEIGFSLTDIGTASKTFGVIIALIGGTLVGALSARFGLMKTLMISGIIHAISNTMFFVLSEVGPSLPWLYVSVGFENLSGGMMTGAFVAYLSSLCNISFTATQYALFSSIMAFTRVGVQSTSGFIADSTSWPQFFGIAIAAAIPGLIVLHYLSKKYPVDLKNTGD